MGKGQGWGCSRQSRRLKRRRVPEPNGATQQRQWRTPTQPSPSRSRALSGYRSFVKIDRPRRGEHAADAVGDGDLRVLHLRGRDAPHLPDALLQGVHAVHARVHVGEAAAVGVQRQLAADRGVPLTDEPGRLARLAEAQVLQAVERQVGEGVVDHQVVDVGVGDPRLVERLLAGDAERLGGGEVLHLADHRRLDALAGSQDVDRLLREVLGPLGAGQDDGAAAVGDQAAHQHAERPGDHRRVQHVVDGDRVLEAGARVLAPPIRAGSPRPWPDPRRCSRRSFR